MVGDATEEAEVAEDDDLHDESPSIVPRIRRQRMKQNGGQNTSQRSGGDEHLPPHKRARFMDDTTRKDLLHSIKQDRFCGYLEDKSIEGILQSMEYYSFEEGEVIIKQGEPGRYFFIIEEGSCRIDVKGVDRGCIGPGASFGAIALLYNCARTATVSAEKTTGVWAADGDNFRTVLKDSLRRHYEDNLRFLDYVSWFGGLSRHQKERIIKLALSVQAFDGGATVIKEGDPPSAIYVVKRGEVSVFSNGKEINQMKAGDTFGEKAVLYDDSASASVTTDGPCEFIVMGIRQMKEALGEEDLSACLERPLINSVLKKMPTFSDFSLVQLHQVVQAMQMVTCGAGQGLPENTQLIVIINGEITGDFEGKVMTFTRAQGIQHETVAELERGMKGQKRRLPKFHALVAGPEGARIALLTKEGFAQVLSDLGFLRLNTSEETEDALRRKVLSKEIFMIRDLPQDKVDLILDQMELSTYRAGAKVFEQGEAGSTFHIIKYGEARVIRDGMWIQTLGSNSCFGERAILMGEPRSASVEVSSPEAQILSISKETFDSILSPKMRELLLLRMELMDTSVNLRSLVEERVIGSGSFGVVRIVRHRWTQKRFALKRVRKENGEVPEAVRTECELLRCVNHPFILVIVRVLESRQGVYILTELVSGGQLYDQLGRMGILTRKQAQFYGGTLVMALEFLHGMHIVYRDLKPENVLLDMTGYLKLIDFGLAKRLDKALHITYTVVGTPAYMAPEVIRGNGHGFEVDVWGLGAMIYEFVAGHLPFGRDGDVQDVIASILEDRLEFPPKYNDNAGKKLITGMLNKDPQSRLGGGVDGWQVIKNHKFFKLSSGNLFSKILSLELDPPELPEGEHYIDEKDAEEMSLTDEGEFYVED